MCMAPRRRCMSYNSVQRSSNELLSWIRCPCRHQLYFCSNRAWFTRWNVAHTVQSRAMITPAGFSSSHFWGPALVHEDFPTSSDDQRRIVDCVAYTRVPRRDRVWPSWLCRLHRILVMHTLIAVVVVVQALPAEQSQSNPSRAIGTAGAITSTGRAARMASCQRRAT